ncbi:MAG: NADH-ubiquinone oxidoreductase-F iron-sulfur binding region domain-containing protein [Dehalococcoidia bacterium]
MTTSAASRYRALEALPRERTSMLPALHAIAEADGWVSPEGLAAVSRHLRVPNSELYGIARSYNELRFEPPGGTPIEVCTGLSCRLAGADALAEDIRASGDSTVEVREVACRFRCAEGPVVSVAHRYIAPADASTALTAAEPRRRRRTHAKRTVRRVRRAEVRRLMAHLGAPSDLESVRVRGAYAGLDAARAMTGEAATEVVAASGLRGRGGAYFPTGVKWQSARAFEGPRYLVVNAEEGEPGVFKDRTLLERDPHLVVEGLLIATHAIEAERCFVYLNGEADAAASALSSAIDEASAAGLLGGTDVEVRRGAGGYVCGEESVILSSIEGERAVPRLKPPLPVERGLWGRPTVINNVETLANLPSIFLDGVESFRSVGTAEQPGTKLISLSGAVARPGLYEVPLGTTLRAVLEDLGGGGRGGHEIRAVVAGGPSGGLLPPSRFDVALLGGSLDPGGAALGAGGIVAIDDSMPLLEIVRHLAAYNAAESCGKCTPCREGTPRMRNLLGEIASGEAPADALELLDALDEAMSSASLCGLGQMAALPYRSARTHFLEVLTGGMR